MSWTGPMWMLYEKRTCLGVNSRSRTSTRGRCPQAIIWHPWNRIRGLGKKSSILFTFQFYLIFLFLPPFLIFAQMVLLHNKERKKEPYFLGEMALAEEKDGREYGCFYVILECINWDISSRGMKVLTPLHKVMVKPCLKFNVQFLSLTLKKDEFKLELGQKKATKIRRTASLSSEKILK